MKWTHYCALWALVLHAALPHSFAQKGKKNPEANPPARPSEKQVLLEKEFIEATQQKILGNTDEAINQFLDVLKKDNENAAANFELALLYQKQKYRDKALPRAERAHQLERDNAHYLKLYSQLLEEEGDFVKAASLYEGLCKKEADRSFFYYEWAFFLIRANKREQAIKVYSQMEKRFGPDFELSMRKHKLYRALSKDKKAQTEIEKYLKRDPQNLDALLLLAEFHQSLKQDDKALAYFRKVLEIDANHTGANIAMSEVFRREGDTLRYLQALKSVFEDARQSPETKYKVLQPLVQDAPNWTENPRKQALLQLTETLVRTHPDYGKGYLLMGNLYLINQRFSEASNTYRQGLQYDKNNLEMWYYLLQSLQQGGRYEELVQDGERVMDLFPAQAIGYYFHALGLWRRGDYARAVEALEQSLPMAGSLPELQFQIRKILGSSLLHLGQHAKGDKVFEKALETQPNDPELLSEYSLCLALRPEKINLALQYGKQANDIAPNVPKFQSNYAFVLYKQQKYEEARSLLKLAMNNGGADDPEILERMGDVLFRMGEIEQAVEQWQKAADRSPYATLLRKKIQTRKLYE